MLSFMRKHARSWFIKVLLGSVIVVFIFFYGFNLRQRRAGLIASVNGVKIGRQEYENQYRRLLEAQPDRSSPLTAEEQRALKETALEYLIERILLMEQAERWKLSVADAELREYIRDLPSFQEEGKFSSARFQQYLRFQRLSEEDFLEEMRRFLLMQKVENLIRDSAKVTDDEVASVYRLFNDRIVIDYVSLSPERFEKDVTLTEGEIEGHFQEHLEDYRIPASVQVAFLKFDPQAFRSQIEVSQDELEERYQATQDRWKVSKQALARDILLRATEEQDPKARMKVLQKAEDLINRIRQEGEDFAKLAKEYSQDPQSASKGGLLGWRRPDQLPPALSKALFEEMKPGEVSDRPVKSPEGFHILKLEEVKAERTRPLEEVKETLEQEIVQEKARQRASELAEQAYLMVFQGASFEEAAARYGVQLEKTPPFSLEDRGGELRMGRTFREAAFALKPGEDFSEVIEDHGVFYILKLLENWPSREAKLAEVEDRVRADLKRVKAFELARQAALALIQRVQEANKPLSEVAVQDGWKVETTQPMGRLFRLGNLPRDLIQDAFALPAGTTLLPRPHAAGDRFLVAEVKERVPADADGLEGQRNLYRSLLLRERRESAFRDWLEKIKKRSEIKRYKAFYEML